MQSPSPALPKLNEAQPTQAETHSSKSATVTTLLEGAPPVSAKRGARARSDEIL